MEYKRKAGKFEIIAYCSEKYEVQVGSLLNKVIELNNKGPKIENGTSIFFGWSRLVVIEKSGKLILHEPDFIGNPFKDYLPQVDITLEIAAQQASFLNHLKVEGVDIKYSDKIITIKDCLERGRIYLERSEIKDEGDSGWYIAEIDDTIKEEYDTIYSYQLLQKRPILMQLLALPPGFLVVVDNNEIIQVFNSKGEDILH